MASHVLGKGKEKQEKVVTVIGANLRQNYNMTQRDSL